MAPLALFLTATFSQAAEVTLAWEEIRYSNAVFYRVYHRESNGHYTFDTPSWEGADTTCTFTGLADGTTHFFVGRSVDANGKVSADSNEIVYHAPPLVPLDPGPSTDPPATDTDSQSDTPSARILFDADSVGTIENR